MNKRLLHQPVEEVLYYLGIYPASSVPMHLK